jgi:hypothetical protein
MTNRPKSKRIPGTSGEPFVCFLLLVSLLIYGLRSDGEQRAAALALSIIFACAICAFVLLGKRRARRQAA